MTFTSAQDTAKFVAASLDLEEWDDVSGIVGETKTFNEVVDVVDRITGKKLKRTYVKEGGGARVEKLLENKFIAEVRGFFFSCIVWRSVFTDFWISLGFQVDCRWSFRCRAYVEQEATSDSSAQGRRVSSALLGRCRLVDAGGLCVMCACMVSYPIECIRCIISVSSWSVSFEVQKTPVKRNRRSGAKVVAATSGGQPHSDRLRPGRRLAGRKRSPLLRVNCSKQLRS